jgi:predicted nuclease of predicted toxin-antitoxin system
VKFLVDNQLARALATLLENFGHSAVHVLDIELSQVDDLAIWAYAAQNGYTIISKDADFADLALLARTEARFIWVRIGNCRKSVLLEAFKNALKTIEQELEAGETLIELY